MTMTAHIINAFTENGKGGNPAAVILDRKDLTPSQRQEIARTIGVSETVFLDDLQYADFYTPTHQIPNCGHATIAAFALANAEIGYSMGGFDMTTSHAPKTRQSIVTDGQKIFLEIPISKREIWQNGSLDDEGKILQALNLSAKYRESALPIYYSGFGTKFILVPVQSSEILRSIQPNLSAINTLSKQFKVAGFYPFTLETEKAGRDAQARMFAPAYGIDEESATGMAAAALAHYLVKERGLQQERILIEQGHHMKKASPSLLETRLQRGWFGQLNSVQIGGQTRTMSELELEL